MKKKVFSFILVLSLLLGSLVFADASADDCNQWYRDGKEALQEIHDAGLEYDLAVAQGKKRKAAKARKKMEEAGWDYFEAIGKYADGNCLVVTGKEFPTTTGMDELGF